MKQPQSPQPAGEPPVRATGDGSLDGSKGRVIVAGFGLVGRVTAERLRAAGIEVTLIERNSETIERQAQLDRPVVCGDATEPRTLQQAGLDTADALILTLPDADAAVRACRIARELNPAIFIAIRTDFVSQGMLATQAGADKVIVEEIVTAEAMQQAVVDRLVK